jgi:hypothetical protein
MSVEDLLARILDILEANFPSSSDEPAYSASTITVPASSSATVTWRVPPEWLVKIRHLYADAAPRCSYEWTLSGYTVAGNEIRFERVAEVKPGGLIRLVVANTGTVDQDIDVLVEGWARRVVM